MARTRITITTDSKVLELEVDEARDIYKQLKDIFEEKSKYDNEDYFPKAHISPYIYTSNDGVMDCNDKVSKA